MAESARVGGLSEGGLLMLMLMLLDIYLVAVWVGVFDRFRKI